MLNRFFQLTFKTAFAFIVASCESGDNGFGALEEASAFLQQENISIVSKHPDEELSLVPVRDVKTFAVSTNADTSNSSLIYNYLVDGVLVDTGLQPFYNLSGANLNASASIFTIQITDGLTVLEADFPIAINTLPSITNVSPSEKSIVVDCTSPLLVFSVEATDVETSELEMKWTLNGGLVDDTIIVETEGNRTRVAVAVDCGESINNELGLAISDGVDTIDYTWTYVDPATAAVGSVGNSAIEFNPLSKDFGLAKTSRDTITEIFTASNTAFSPVYITNFDGQNDHFTIESNNCPVAPEKFEPGADCTMVIKFAPLAAGNLGTNIKAVYYPEGANEDEFQSILGVSGTGVSPLEFDGVQSTSDLTHNSVRLNWAQTNSAATFVAFRLTGTGPNYDQIYDSTIINSSGTVSSMVIENLTPATAYRYRVRATDVFGNFDSNTVDITFTTNANRPPSPTINSTPSLYSGEYISTVDAFDSNTNNDTDVDGDVLVYACTYTRSDNAVPANCSSLANESGGNASFSGPTGILSNWQPLHADIGVTFNFTITATDPYNESRTVTFNATVIQGTPDAPSITSVLPASASNNNSPIVSGTGAANLVIELYAGAACSTLLGSGTVDGTGNFSITASVNDDTVTHIHGRIVNSIGNRSTCSATSVTYTEDSTAPTPFIVDGTTPGSPANDLTPFVTGTSETGATISLFDNSSCAGPALDTDTAAGDGSYSLTFTATADTSNTVWVVASDAAGNTTSCSDKQVDYVHYSIADGIGYFRGGETNSTVEPSFKLNPTTATDLEYSESFYDSTYFDHNLVTNSHQIKVKVAGDYFFSFNAPLEFLGDYRPAVRFDAYVNGTLIKGAVGESTYIRNASNHNESSGHFSVLARGLNVDDIVTVKVVQTASGSSSNTEYVTVSGGGKFQLIAEHIDPGSRTYFYGASIPLEFNNTARKISWNVDTFHTSGFTDDDGANPSHITLTQNGDYLVYVNVPVESDTERTSPMIKVMLSTDGGTSFSEVSSLKGLQGYIRDETGHNNSSIHISGILSGISANDIIRVESERVSNTGNTNITAGYHASIFIDKIDTANDVLFVNDDFSSTYNWNTNSSTTIDWDSPVYIDNARYGITGGDQVDIVDGGDYLLIYNDTLTVDDGNSGTNDPERPNVQVSIWLNGVEQKDSQLKTHYIRNERYTNRPDDRRHMESSGAIVYLLRNIPDNSFIEMRTLREANGGNVRKIDDSQLVLIKKR